jgi:periplasmic protein TonB
LPTAGELAPLSRIVLAPPRLPDVRMHPLPMPVAMYDAEAPEMAAPDKDLGLPWMKDKNDSAGPGAAGVGNNPGRGMGRNGFDGEGEAESALRFGSIASEVSCKYCPDPAYSEEARQQKLQGTVAMRVLVGADGRVKDVQLKRRLGLGLDENAVQAVRSWQFIPAKDAARRPLASWITVETLFRLY